MAGNPRHIIRDQKIDSKYLSYINNLSTGNNTTNVTSSKDSIKQYVKSKNGIFNGAFGSIGQALTISSGRLDLTANSTGAVVIRRMVYVSPESGTSDTLDNIELTGLELPYQELTLISSTNNTITITHNGSAGGTSKNIYCPGDTDYVLAPNEAVKLIYDPINIIWVVTGNASSSGVSNPVNASLDLGGNTIQKVTTLYLNGDGDNSHSITGTTGGLDYNVENTDETHDFGVNGTAKLSVSNTTVSTPVDLLVTGDMTTNSNLVVFGNTTLGNASSDNISMNGTLATDIEMGGNDLDFATGGTIDFHNIVTSGITGGAASALPSNPSGYFTVKWQGNTRYIPYYS